MKNATTIGSRLGASVVAACLLTFIACGQCGGRWSDTFGAFELQNPAESMVGYDDGTGNKLYVGMEYNGPVNGQWTNTVVLRWNGARALDPVGNIGDGGVSKMMAYDDGSGMKLYAAGTFSTAGTSVAVRLARWNGSSWSPIGGATWTDVYDLAVFNDGTGPALFAGGALLRKWNGTAWTQIVGSLGTPPGATSTPFIRSLAVFDWGLGPRLIAAGAFSSINGVPANNIASWNGTSWSPLGAGITQPAPWQTSTNPFVQALLVHDDGSGPRLFVGGRFQNAGGLTVNGVASWDGAAWHQLQTGVNGDVRSFVVLPTSLGPRLVVGGWFTTAGGLATGGVALWNGSALQSMGAVGRGADTMLVFDAGFGPELYIVGVIGVNNNGITPWSVYQRELQKYDGTSWLTFQHGIDGPYPALSLCTHDDGSGPALYAGGGFASAGSALVQGIARWNGAVWSPVGQGLAGGARALASCDDGNGLALFAAEQVYGSSCSTFQVKRWNGAAWSNAGGLSNCDVWDLEAVDLGAGPSLYACGAFTAIGAVGAAGVARWNGSSWAPLGPGLTGAGPYLYNGANCMARFDDGSGPALYVGGSLAQAGGLSISGIARWNGASWSPVGGGLTTGTSTPANVTALAVHDDGSGAKLYAAGKFSFAGGVPVNAIARWNGSSWTGVGGGFGSTWQNWNPDIRLESFDDGAGARLYAAGIFSTAGGTLCNGTAVWNGTSWQPLGAGLSPFTPLDLTNVSDFAVYDSGTGPELFMCGDFQGVDGKRSVHIASRIPARPSLSMFQLAGPGSGVVVANWNLTPGANVLNVFSFDPCPSGPGTGPYFGLCALNVAPLFMQVGLPTGAVPFHYTASSDVAAFGPYPGVPGLTVDGVCLDFTGNSVHCVSAVSRLTVQ